jgi:hypothetical protein
MRRLALLLALGSGIFAARFAAAHHSFAAVFDGDKPVKMTGQVTDVEWTNPHFHFSIDVKDPAGAVTRWRFEGYPPNMLVRQGWKRDETLMPGATVTVDGWASRDDATLGAVRWVTFADGKKLAGGPPAGTGGR